jgi:hypothetical protein
MFAMLRPKRNRGIVGKLKTTIEYLITADLLMRESHMERSKSTTDILGLKDDECEECNGTGTRLSLDLDTELIPCEWCAGTGSSATPSKDSGD